MYTSKQDNKGNKGVVMDSVETKKSFIKLVLN